MYPERVCLVCTKHFVPKWPGQVVCCEECRKERRILRYHEIKEERILEKKRLEEALEEIRGEMVTLKLQLKSAQQALEEKDARLADMENSLKESERLRKKEGRQSSATSSATDAEYVKELESKVEDLSARLKVFEVAL